MGCFNGFLSRIFLDVMKRIFSTLAGTLRIFTHSRRDVSHLSLAPRRLMAYVHRSVGLVRHWFRFFLRGHRWSLLYSSTSGFLLVWMRHGIPVWIVHLHRKLVVSLFQLRNRTHFHGIRTVERFYFSFVLMKDGSHLVDAIARFSNQVEQWP